MRPSLLHLHQIKVWVYCFYILDKLYCWADSEKKELLALLVFQLFLLGMKNMVNNCIKRDKSMNDVLHSWSWRRWIWILQNEDLVGNVLWSWVLLARDLGFIVLRKLAPKEAAPGFLSSLSHFSATTWVFPKSECERRLCVRVFILDLIFVFFPNQNVSGGWVVILDLLAVWYLWDANAI